MKITSNIVGQALINQPDLSINGFPFSQWGQLIPATNAEFKEWRDQLLTNSGVEEVQTAYDYIQSNPIAFQEPVVFL